MRRISLKDGLWTFDPSAELTITILSSIAQEESRNLSTNVTWGQRKRFADGKVSMPYKRFLGYDRSEDGEPVVNEEQAELVRRIYAMCINGFTPHGIASALTQEGVPTPGGKTVWQTNVVESILTNEKYKGDALLQKTFCTDYLTKKMKVNEGEVPSYYVKNSHPPIVSAELFDHVQRELERRSGLRCVASAGCFAGHVVCGDCGGIYGAKVWHSNSKYRRTVWRCNNKYDKGGEKCCTPHFYDDQLKAMFIQVMNERFTRKDEIIVAYNEAIDVLTSNRQLDDEQKRLQTEIDIVLDMMRRMVLENARIAQNQSEYRERYGALVKRHDGMQAQLDEVDRQIAERNAKRSRLEQALKVMKKCKGLLQEFDEELWHAVIDKLIVHDSEHVTFVFKDGSENEWRG